jgi:hypothetical protein
MKKIVEYLEKKNLIFKTLKPILPKELGSRKRVGIYLGVDLDGYYAIILQLEKRSRVVQKEAQELMVLNQQLMQVIDSNIPKKYITIQAPLCSKAKALFESQSWVVWHELNTLSEE